MTAKELKVQLSGLNSHIGNVSRQVGDVVKWMSEVVKAVNDDRYSVELGLYEPDSPDVSFRRSLELLEVVRSHLDSQSSEYREVAKAISFVESALSSFENSGTTPKPTERGATENEPAKEEERDEDVGPKGEVERPPPTYMHWYRHSVLFRITIPHDRGTPWGVLTPWGWQPGIGTWGVHVATTSSSS